MPSVPRIAALLALAGAAAFTSACSGGGGSNPVPTMSTSPGSTSPASSPTPWNPTIQEFALSGQNAGPQDIVAGADGDLWFTEPQGGAIGRMTTSGTLVATYPVPNTSFALSGMALGSDGNVWFSDIQANFLAKINTSGNITEISMPANTSPRSPISGPGGDIWFSTASGVGHLAPSSTTPTLYSLNVTSQAFAIAPGPNNDLWFSESFGQRLGRVAANGTGLQEFPIPVPSASFEPGGLTTGPDGAVWTVGDAAGTNNISQTGYVVRVTTGGQITLFQAPSQPSSVGDIVAGPDGFLYATEVAGVHSIGQIMRITPQTGHIDEITLPAGSGGAPDQITVGPDGNIWFTESRVAKIGRLLLH